MSDPLYRRELIRLAADARGAGRLPHPDASGEAFNPTCGDRVTVDISLVGGRITALAHETRACVLAQASAAILGASLTGMTRADVEGLRESVIAMLSQRGVPPEAPFDAYAVFDGVADHVARHTCVLLPMEAVIRALENGERSEPAGKGA